MALNSDRVDLLIYSVLGGDLPLVCSSSPEHYSGPDPEAATVLMGPAGAMGVSLPC